jgi:hypothetical protein
MARPGAALAVDIIDDRIAHQFPEHLKTLLGLAFSAGDALPEEKATTLIASLVNLQHDPEIAPMILGSLQSAERAGGSSWYTHACMQLAESGPLQTKVRELLARDPNRMVPFSSTNKSPLEILAMIEVSAARTPDLTAPEAAVLDEIRTISGLQSGDSVSRLRPSSNEFIIRQLTARFADGVFAESLAALLGATFASAQQLPPSVLGLINRLESLADHAYEIWPIVNNYTVLGPL